MKIGQFFKMASLATMVGGASFSAGCSRAQNNNSEQNHDVCPVVQHYDVSPVAMMEETGQAWRKIAHQIEYQKVLSDLRMFQNGYGGTYTYDPETQTGVGTMSVDGYTRTIRTNSQNMPVQLTEDYGNSYTEIRWRDNGTRESKVSNTDTGVQLIHEEETYDKKGNLEYYLHTSKFKDFNHSKKIEKQFKGGYLVSESIVVNHNGKQKTSSTKIEHNGSETTVTTEMNGSVRVQKFLKDQLISDSNKTEATKKQMSAAEKQKRLEKHRHSK